MIAWKGGAMKNNVLKAEIAEVLRTSGAHADFEKAIKGFPLEDAGRRPKGVPWSAWQLLEHMRFTQADILEYVTTPDYAEKKWPEDYWPKSPAPSSTAEWNNSIDAFRKDREALRELALDKRIDLTAAIPHGNGQTYLREIVLAADHTAYHVGQLILVRQLLGIWK